MNLRQHMFAKEVALGSRYGIVTSAPCTTPGFVAVLWVKPDRSGWDNFGEPEQIDPAMLTVIRWPMEMP
jgi:hypothetical protein